MRILYGRVADELVVRFDSQRYPEPVVVPLTTPQYDYAGLIVDNDTGTVIGIHVYPLLAFAVKRHPAWRAAAAPDPAPEVATRIVGDIKSLFDAYGVEPPDSGLG
jgi:hypothetical protein